VICHGVSEDRLRQLAALGLQALHLIGDVELRLGAQMPEFLDLGFELGDGLFEFEKADGHEYSGSPRGRLP
jgi:hypothetical protein